MSIPELNVVDVYSINKKDVNGLMVVVEPTPEMMEENMIGVGVDFAMHNGQVIEAGIDRVFGYKGNFHLFFPRLTKVFKPIGFSDPDEVETFTFDTGGEA